MDTKKDYSTKNLIISLILTFISSFAFTVTNGYFVVPEDKETIRKYSLFTLVYQLEQSIADADYVYLALCVLLFVAIYRIISSGIDKRLLPSAIPFSLIGALFVLLCKSYYKYESWEEVFGSTSAFATSALKGAGIAVLFFLVYVLIDRVQFETKLGEVYKGTPFKSWLKVMLLFVLCWLPYVAIMIPGSMNSDTKDQLAQVINNPDYCWTVNAVVREEGSSLLNNYHPVFHTALLAVFLKIGELIHSYKISFALMCIAQEAAIGASLSLAVTYLRWHLGISKRLYRVLIVFCAINPLLPLWGTTLTKDALFIVAMLLCTVMLYDCFKNPENFKTKKFVCLALVLFYTMISRNNGFYLVLLLLPFAIIHFRKDKRALVRITAVLLIPILLFKVGYTGIFFKAADIQESSPREMLSIPFQQTARYIVEYGDDISPEEEEAILKVLPGKENASLEQIAQKYVPYISDDVKSLYNKNAQTEDLVNYFKAWFKGLTKHPDSYIQAFFSMNYSWFGFDSPKDNIYYVTLDKNITEMIHGLNFPKKLAPVRAVVREGVHILDKIPMTSVLFEFSVYTWVYAIVFIALLRKKKYTELLAFLPLFFNYAICFVGPVAYMRYAIPMVACLPFVFVVTYAKQKET